MSLSEFVGTWSGTNGFRLMPADPLVKFPATASVTTAAGGHLTLLAYAWQHPDDGPQDGLILIESTGEGDALAVTWGDSWHQKPDTMSLSGLLTADGLISFEGSYAGDWGWRIHLGVGDEPRELLIRMENVIPAEHASADMPAGPYPVMILDLAAG
ncbi:hypothetical protein GCM10022223_45540 [Kineosporia mesophila]|uniref:DUF1579 domain-containing protein n=1 Tax=Kineosporia mesophila TaxID=566012 RepID=A0ABP7A246_9ACTN|nr:hypothetical protein [Kineosporia mesophila]MCD5348972.1 hypothetical protein [Kineosporia mesophila]